MNSAVPIPADAANLPVKYETARKALAECAHVDELKEWTDKAAALAVYAKQAKDNSLHQYALRIQARAQRRMGQLLKSIPGNSGGDRGNAATGGRRPLVQTRTSVAESAGLSEHQRKTAIRVASVPENAFEQQVESCEPPSITRLAEQGTATRVEDREEERRSRTRKETREALNAFLRFCREHHPKTSADSVEPADARELAQQVQVIDVWLDGFITQLPKCPS
jgi:hypothetical protein